MSRTYRKNMDSVKGWDRENATKIEKTKKPKWPQNKPSKLYEKIIHYDFSIYEAGNQYGQGHKTFHKRNQELNQKVRTVLKREFKKELDELIDD